MNVTSFIAESAVDAVAQIRERLGPNAVVLNIRRLPATGLSRLWSRPRIEVLAHVPETVAPSAPTGSARLLDVTEASPVSIGDSAPEPDFTSATRSRYSMPGHGAFRQRTLDALGLLPRHAERVLEAAAREANGSLRGDLTSVRSALEGFWRPSDAARQGLHVFVGPPGSGKTTALCKWLTQVVLLEGARARVWRLDVPRANTAEALSVHGEILGVPIERAWNPGARWPEEFLFIDLPGVDASDAAALGDVERLLSTMPDATVSLVLNGAYDARLLETQVRAFSRLPLAGLIVTHLDEEPRWSKLWNLVLGTNVPLAFLSAGQNIPGQFLRATPGLLIPEEMRVS